MLSGMSHPQRATASAGTLARIAQKLSPDATCRSCSSFASLSRVSKSEHQLSACLAISLWKAWYSKYGQPLWKHVCSMLLVYTYARNISTIAYCICRSVLPLVHSRHPHHWCNSCGATLYCGSPLPLLSLVPLLPWRLCYRWWFPGTVLLRCRRGGLWLGRTCGQSLPGKHPKQ